MGIKVEKEIGGRKVVIGGLSCEKAVKVQLVIAQAVGEPLFKAVSGKDGANNQGAITAALGAVAKNIEYETLMDTMRTVFECVTIDGKRINSIDETFNGRSKDMWLVFIEALKANFADFLPANP